MAKNKLLRMDNVGIVVESLDDAISFFTELGLKLEGRMKVEGEWAGRSSVKRSLLIPFTVGSPSHNKSRTVEHRWWSASGS